MRLCFNFQNVIKCVIIIAISCLIIFHCIFSGQNVTVIHSFYSYVHKLEPNIVLGSVDKAVTSLAVPMREADENIMLGAVKC